MGSKNCGLSQNLSWLAPLWYQISQVTFSFRVHSIAILNYFVSAYPILKFYKLLIGDVIIIILKTAFVFQCFLLGKLVPYDVDIYRVWSEKESCFPMFVKVNKLEKKHIWSNFLTAQTCFGMKNWLCQNVTGDSFKSVEMLVSYLTFDIKTIIIIKIATEAFKIHQILTNF